MPVCLEGKNASVLQRDNFLTLNPASAGWHDHACQEETGVTSCAHSSFYKEAKEDKEEMIWPGGQNSMFGGWALFLIL